MAVPTDPRDRLPPFLRRYCPTQEQCRQWSAHGRQAVQRWVGWLWHDSAPRWQRLEWPWKLWSICVLFSVVFLPLFFIHGRSHTEVAIEQPPAAIVDDTTKTVVSDVPPLVTPPDPPSQPQVATASEPSTETAPAPAKHGKKRRKPQPATAHDETPTPPSPFAREVYRIQQRFVAQEVFNANRIGGPDISIYYLWEKAGCPNTERWHFSPLAETIMVRNGNFFRIRGWVAFPAYRPDNKPNDNHDATLSYTCHMILDPELGTWKLSGHIEKID